MQMGGPIRRNKAFFFASVQRYQALSDPVGPVANSEDISPRINLKFTLQPTARDTIILGTQYHQYNLTGRVGYWPSSQATDRQTVEEDAPEWVWNAQWRRSFGTSALFEAKITGYTGYYYLDPVDPSPFTYDGGTNTYTGGGGGHTTRTATATRSRRRSPSTRRSSAATRSSSAPRSSAAAFAASTSPYGPAGFYLYQDDGVPYYRVSYGYDVQGTTTGRRPTCRISGARAARR